MKEVKGIVILKCNQKPGLFPMDWSLIIERPLKIIQECLQQWKKSDNIDEIELEFKIKSKFQFKTTSQLGYLNAGIYPCFFQFYKDQGVVKTEKQIKDELKTHPDIMFCEENESLLTRKKYIVPKSCSGASKEEVMDFITRLLILAGEFGIEIETPEDYKKRKGIKEFTK